MMFIEALLKVILTIDLDGSHLDEAKMKVMSH